MSLAISLFTPRCVCLAADTRTLGISRMRSDEGIHVNPFVLTDDAEKLLYVPSLQVGLVVYGEAHFGHIAVVEALTQIIPCLTEKTDLAGWASELMMAVQTEYNRPHLFMFVGGFPSPQSDQAKLYFLDVAQGRIESCTEGPDGPLRSGLRAGGETWLVDFLHQDSISSVMMYWPPDQVARYAEFLVEATIKASMFRPQIPSCGGSVNVLLMTPGSRKQYRRSVPVPLQGVAT